MTMEIQSVMRSAQFLGQTLLLIFLVLLASIVGLVVWSIVDLPQIGQAFSVKLGYGGGALIWWQSFAFVLFLLVQIGIWAAAVWQGRQIFTALTTGALIDASIAAKKTAWLLWGMLIWGIVAHILGTVVATWYFPEGTRALEVAFGSTQISTAFAALLATFTSHAFVLGAALWQDHKEVI